MRRSTLPAQLLAILATCCVALPAAAAAAEPEVAMHPSFLPDRLGASSALTLAFRFAGGEEATPPPVRQVVVEFPAGARINVGGVQICPRARLARKGPAGCPRGSVVGRGHAVLQVHAGSQAIPEQAAVVILRGPDHEGLPTFEIYGHGNTPLDQTAISSETLETDKPPYGWRTVTTVPPIPTIAYEPDASILSMSVTIGGNRSNPRAHAAAGTILVPHSCPAGGFPFAVEATFADNSSAHTTVTAPCP